MSVSLADSGLVNTFVKFSPISRCGESPCILLAVLSQRKIGETGMLTPEAPSGLAVSGQVDDGKFVAHCSIVAAKQCAVDRIIPNSCIIERMIQPMPIPFAVVDLIRTRNVRHSSNCFLAPNRINCLRANRILQLEQDL